MNGENNNRKTWNYQNSPNTSSEITYRLSGLNYHGDVCQDGHFNIFLYKSNMLPDCHFSNYVHKTGISNGAAEQEIQI